MSSVRNFLKNHYLEIKKKNTKYSIRAYSNKVGIHSTALNEIINGDRKISKEMAERIARNLSLTINERIIFFDDYLKESQNIHIIDEIEIPISPQTRNIIIKHFSDFPIEKLDKEQILLIKTYLI